MASASFDCMVSDGYQLCLPASIVWFLMASDGFCVVSDGFQRFLLVSLSVFSIIVYHYSKATGKIVGEVLYEIYWRKGIDVEVIALV